MHVRAGTKEAEKIDAVFVDGKYVKMPFEFNMEEGWCDAYVPKLMETKEYVAGETVTEEKDMQFEYEIIRLRGVITVNQKENTNE